MAIGTPQQIIGLVANSASGAVLSTTQNTPTGSLIVVWVGAWADTNGTVSSVTDSVGNTYILAIQRTATAGEPYPCAIYYCSNTPNNLPNGGSITVSNSGSATQDVGAWSVTGANGGLDVSKSTFVSGAAGATITSGALASSSEIFFGGTSTVGSLTGYAANSPFTEINFGFTGSMNASGFAYGIVSSNSSVNFAPTWNLASASVVLASFKATAAAAHPLRFNSNLDGLGASGGFFRDPLGAKTMIGWRQRASLWIPDRGLRQ